MEETIRRALEIQQEGTNRALNADPPSSDSNPDVSVPKYLSGLKTKIPDLEPLLTSPNPDHVEVIHAIMRWYAGTMHVLLEELLNKESLWDCAGAALVGFQEMMTALGVVGEELGVVEREGESGKDASLRNGKGRGEGAGGE